MQTEPNSFAAVFAPLDLIPSIVSEIQEIHRKLSLIPMQPAPKPDGDGWLDSKEAANYLSMSEKTFDKYCRITTPRIKRTRVGGKNYFKKSDLDIFMKTFALKSEGLA